MRNTLLFILILGITLGKMLAQPTFKPLIPGNSISIKVGENCGIVLDETLEKAGYIWEDAFTAYDQIYKVSESFKDGKRIFVFKGIKDGNVVITFKTVNPELGKTDANNTLTCKVIIGNASAVVEEPVVVMRSARPVSKPTPIGTSSAAPKATATVASGAKPVATSGAKPASIPSSQPYYAANDMQPKSLNSVQTAFADFRSNAVCLSATATNRIKAGDVFCIDVADEIPGAKWVYSVDRNVITPTDDQMFRDVQMGNIKNIRTFKFRADYAGNYAVTFHLFSSTNPSIDKYITYKIQVSK